jgi:hypothetical protein
MGEESAMDVSPGHSMRYGKIMKLMTKKVDGYDCVSPTRYFKYTPLYEIEASLRTVLVRGNPKLIQ